MCHVINTVIAKVDDGENIVFNTFAECLSQYESSNQERVIVQFLQDANLVKLLIPLLPKLKTYNSDTQSLTDVILNFAIAIETSIFEKKDISILDALPKDFDYEPYKENTLKTLEESLENNIEGVKRWISHHQDFIPILSSIGESVSTDLHCAIYEVTKDIDYLSNTGKPWSEFYISLKKKTEALSTEYLLSTFKGKNTEFINECKVLEVVEEHVFDGIIWSLLDEADQYDALLRAIAELYTTKDLSVISEYISKGINISHIYNALGSYLNSLIKEDEGSVSNFFETCKNANILLKDIVGIEALSDEMLVELFVQNGDADNLNSIENFDLVPIWLNKQSEHFVCKFLQSCQTVFVDDEDIEAIGDTIQAIEPELFKDAISDLNVDNQYKLLKLCPNDYSRNIVATYFASTELFDLYIGEQWKKLKTEVPYVSFDLESDGESIREFAFRMDENTKVHQGEEQLGSLLRALTNTEIIVGHRIKEWDLGTVLKKKGFESSAFVWDTLEIEILLNPCRYSYALHTGHTAQEDTELVDRLFWNQLYRLSQNDELCSELSVLLPKKIKTILDTLKHPIFADFFNKDSDESSFYQILADIDNKIILKLEEINSSIEKSLIVAPKRLWSRIAEHVNLRFIQTQEDFDYMTISPDRLSAQPLNDRFQNFILQRFIRLSKTPVVANIAQYLRINYLTNGVFRLCC